MICILRNNSMAWWRIGWDERSGGDSLWEMAEVAQRTGMLLYWVWISASQQRKSIWGSMWVALEAFTLGDRRVRTDFYKII